MNTNKTKKMKDKKIYFAVVGVGHIGKRHIEMIDRNPACELLAVCDIDHKSIDQSVLPDVEIYRSIDDMLNNEKAIDVVCICTPNGLHAEHAIKSIENGSHVIIEKPIGLSRAECDKVIFKALRNNKQIFCVMQNRYSPPSEWIKSIIDKKLLGNIHMVQLNCYWNRDDRYYKEGGWKGTRDLDGGTLFTQFSHFIDIMYWLFGDVSNIKSRFADFTHQLSTDFEDTGIISFDFNDGGIGSINYSTSVWNQNLESSMTVIGESGSVKIGGQYMNEVEICNIENYKMPKLPPTNPGNDYGAYKGSAANHHYIFDNVVDTLRGNSAPTTNALEGLKVVEIIERIYKHNELRSR
jgi:UDP-N-acetyl-2-amino-2-deoxyglucuronate dehydrogenase